MLKNRKYILYSLLLFLTLLSVMPFLAPVLAYYGYHKLSNSIYWIYSLICHQKAHRSMFFFDEQCAWCVRDTFIWWAITITAYFIFFGKVKTGISKKAALLLCFPMILDGSIQFLAALISLNSQTTPFYESTNLTRSITGSLFGLGIGLFFFPRVNKELTIP